MSMTMTRTGEIAATPAPRPRRDRLPAFAYVSVAPLIAIMIAVVGMPLAYSLYLSFNSTNPITKRWFFVGFDNYARVFDSSEFWTALGRTAYFSVVSVAGAMILGTVIALVLNEKFPGRGLVRSVVLIPWAMAPVSIGVLWSFVYAGDFGLLNGLLNDIGLGSLASAWLGNGFRALNLVALTQVWNQAPLVALMLLSGLQSMPGNLHRAAILDGAGPVRRFFSITFPWLKQSLLFVTIIATINALMTFDIIWIMTRGGPGAATTLLSWLGYMQSFQYLRFGEGAATLYVLTALSLLLAGLYFLVLRPRRSREAPAVALADAAFPLSVRRHKMVRLPDYAPKQRLSATTARTLGRSGFSLVAILIVLWSALPVLALVMISLSPARDLVRTPPSMFPTSFTFDNYTAVLFPADGTTSVQARRVPIALTNSFLVGAIVSVLNVALGTLAGYGFSRYTRRRFFSITLWTLLITRMIPALTLVLPFFMLFRTLGLLDTYPGLVIAYSSILLPLSAWMMKTTFDTVPTSLDRAGLIDGCSHPTMLWKVLIPVVRPGIIAALIFCFLVSWNEFLFAMILTGTPKTQTIPVIIAGFLSQARFYEYGPLFAASVLAILPPVAVAFFFQRFLVQGALSGAVKG